jgi:hypothetical protein
MSHPLHWDVALHQQVFDSWHFKTTTLFQISKTNTQQHNITSQKNVYLINTDENINNNNTYNNNNNAST